MKWVSFFGKIWYKNMSTFQVSEARPQPNHTWVAPPPRVCYTDETETETEMRTSTVVRQSITVPAVVPIGLLKVLQISCALSKFTPNQSTYIITWNIKEAFWLLPALLTSATERNNGI